MGNRTGIEWTDATWNPVTGCTKVSAGCKFCYAERVFPRIYGGGSAGRPFTQVVCHPERPQQPLRWRTPRRIFVCSMGDLFHDDIPESFLDKVFDVMHETPEHTYQILTKRPQRMIGYITALKWRAREHIWLGVSCEDQQTADERIPILLETPAAVRWVSLEPLLGWVMLRREWMLPPPGPRLDWVVLGGESGPHARPMDPTWARSVRDQCGAAGVPFFFKQWGEWCPPSQMPGGTFSAWEVKHGLENGRDRELPWRCGKRSAGRNLDGQEWNEFPTREGT